MMIAWWNVVGECFAIHAWRWAGILPRWPMIAGVLAVVLVVIPVMAEQMREAEAQQRRFCAWDDDTVLDESAKAPPVAELLAGGMAPLLPETLVFRIRAWYRERQFSGDSTADIPPQWLRDRPDDVMALIDSYSMLADYARRVERAELAPPMWLADLPAHLRQLPDSPAMAVDDLLRRLDDTHPTPPPTLAFAIAARTAHGAFIRGHWTRAKKAAADALAHRAQAFAATPTSAAATAPTGFASSRQSVLDDEWLRVWLDYRVALYWETAAAEPARLGRTNLHALALDDLLGVDWRMREDAVRVANSPVFGATPSTEFYANARELIAAQLGQQLAHDANFTAATAATPSGESQSGLMVSPLRLRGVVVDWLVMRGETVAMAPVYEWLGELCSLAGDRNLAFRAYRLARRLFLEHARLELTAAATPDAEWLDAIAVAMVGDTRTLAEYLAKRPDLRRPVGIQRANYCNRFMENARDGSRNPDRDRQFSDRYIETERDHGHRRQAGRFAQQRHFVRRHVDPHADVARLATRPRTGSATALPNAAALLVGLLVGFAVSLLMVMLWHRGPFPAKDGPLRRPRPGDIPNVAAMLDAAANLPLPRWNEADAVSPLVATAVADTDDPGESA